jgi:ectoine hydroxylase-related dioxygenase (phytanoyl-CoA dioxygenase family)
MDNNGLSISDADVSSYDRNGFLIVKGVIGQNELDQLRIDTAELMVNAQAQMDRDSDYMFAPGHLTGKPVLRRVEFVIDKSQACKVLLGHPFILRSVEKLMGRDFFPTWDAMVLKAPGEGIIVPWHRDAGTEFVGDKPIFNVDFYLDEATLDTCLWVIPGSHKWDTDRATREIEQLNRGGFGTSGAIPVPMQSGDVIFHDILVLHGSPASTGNLRRVLYYEFRTAHVEEHIGPHTNQYIPLKQKVLLKCLDWRQKHHSLSQTESPFHYAPPSPYNTVKLEPGEEIGTYRYPHRDFWRNLNQ